MLEKIKIWNRHYSGTAEVLAQMAKVESVATAFNTNIDAVLKISGKTLARIAADLGVEWEELNNPEHHYLQTPQDFVKGAFRCFSKGIAEEWLADKKVFDWMVKNIGFDRLQMGGQGGIVANAMAVCGVKKVYNHCSSLPEQQAKLFADLGNLLSFDENGMPQKAHKINRTTDVPLIHWIIEFNRGDSFELGEHKITCPKANRFIATYDPLNSRLVMDANFTAYLNQHPVNAVVLSGYHALTAENDGVSLVEGSAPVIKRWQNDGALIHLEVASTQDKLVRQAIVEKIASQADSIGLNEREAIEVLQVIGEDDLAAICEADTSAVNLLEAVLKIKQKVKCARIQLHMFGMYLTIQNKNFRLSPQQNRDGMCLAATIAAGKAGTGSLDNHDKLLWANGRDVCTEGLEALQAVGGYIGDDNFIDEGIGSYLDFDIIAVPTILIAKPVTLVGMGDTISSVSLIGAMAA